jgi:hypothetical protein
MELDADGEVVMAAARKAYEAYADRAGWKSLVTGDPLPQWADLSGSVMNGWFAAATAVIRSFRVQSAEGGDVTVTDKHVDAGLLALREIDESREGQLMHPNEAAALLQHIAALQREHAASAAQRDALREYGGHLDDCTGMAGALDPRCTCGFRAALAGKEQGDG